jgi:hypothetical protein
MAKLSAASSISNLNDIKPLGYQTAGVSNRWRKAAKTARID